MTYRKAIKHSLDVAKGFEFLEQSRFVHRYIKGLFEIFLNLNKINFFSELKRFGSS